MMTLRDLNSPIRLLHRTTVGRVFSLLLRSFSLVTVISYASSLSILISKLNISNEHSSTDAFHDVVHRILKSNQHSKVIIPSKEVRNFLFDIEGDDNDEDHYHDSPYHDQSLAWRKLLSSDKISYLNDLTSSAAIFNGEFNSTSFLRSSTLENVIYKRINMLNSINYLHGEAREDVLLWHAAGLNHVLSKLCLESIAIDPSIVIEPFVTAKPHKQLIHFSIALPQGTSLRNEMNAGILNLRNRGVLERLERRWDLTSTPCKNIKNTKHSSTGTTNIKIFGGFSVVFCSLWLLNLFWAIWRRRRKMCHHFHGDQLRTSKNENHASHHQPLPKTRDGPPSPVFDQPMTYNIPTESTALTSTAPSASSDLAPSSSDLHQEAPSQVLRGPQRSHHQAHHHHHRHRQHSRRRDRNTGSAVSTANIQKGKVDAHPTWRRQTNIF